MSSPHLSAFPPLLRGWWLVVCWVVVCVVVAGGWWLVAGVLQYVFSFVGTPRAAEVMGGIVTRWKTLMGLPIGTAAASSSSSSTPPPPPVTSVTTASSLLAGLSSELAPTEDTRQREGVEAHEEREAEHTHDELEVLRGQGQLKRSLHALADRHHQESGTYLPACMPAYLPAAPPRAARRR
jgi:hypothetical protein